MEALMSNVVITLSAPHLIPEIEHYAANTPFPINLILELALNTAIHRFMKLPIGWTEESIGDDLLDFYNNPSNGMLSESVLWELRDPGNPSGEKTYSQMLHEIECSKAMIYGLADSMQFIFTTVGGLNELAATRILQRCVVINGIIFMEFGAYYDLSPQPL